MIHSAVGTTSVVVGMLAAAVLAGCEQKSDCRTACLRVAECKDSFHHGKRPMGSKPPAPDPGCMKKCETRPDDFAACEGRKRTCEQLRLCRGDWQQ